MRVRMYGVWRVLSRSRARLEAEADRINYMLRVDSDALKHRDRLENLVRHHTRIMRMVCALVFGGWSGVRGVGLDACLFGLLCYPPRPSRHPPSPCCVCNECVGFALLRTLA